MAETLYDLANARDILDGWFEEHEGEVTPELEQLLTELDGRTDEKIERVALYIREQLATAKAIKEEEERLAMRRKARENRAESLKRYLQDQMERLGKAKVEGLLCTVALQKNPPSVKGTVADDQLLAMWGDEAWTECVTFKPSTYTLNARAVLERHKSGAPIPPGLTVDQGQSLRIR